MTPERYARICELFDQAVEISPGKRTAFLRLVCGSDSELHEEVERLLRKDVPAHGAGFLGDPAPGLVLCCVGRAVLDAGMDAPPEERLAGIARAAWTSWTTVQDAAARRAALKGLVALAADEVRREAEAAALELAADRPTAVRQALAAYLGRVPAAVLHAVKRAAAGASKGRLRLHDAADLAALLPPHPPLLPRANAPAAPVRDDGPVPTGITLTVTEGPHAGQAFAFAEHDTFLVGRSRHAHFRLPAKDMYFSRLHFLVEVNPPCCRLLDLGSRNGTFVNGERVTTADLSNGAQIKAGHTLMHVTIHAAEAARPLPPPSPIQDAPTAPHLASLGQAELAADACLVCGRTTGRDKPGSVPVCAVCRERALGQPQPIAGYHLLGELGRGGLGVVFLALREADGEPVTVKTLTPALAAARTDVDHFLHEAAVLRTLDHPHLVRFGDMGESHGLLYITREYVRGVDAGQLLREHGPLPVGRAVNFACQVLEALEYAHARGFVHRDIKPANLFIMAENFVKLADFGLARVYQASKLSGLTMTGNVGGSMDFMAPEQVTQYRDVQPPADLYATAATLYYLLTGHLVHDSPGPPQLMLLKILEEEPVPLRQRRPDIPEELAAIIHQALARDPDQRFAGAREMREALQPFAG